MFRAACNLLLSAFAIAVIIIMTALLMFLLGGGPG